MAATLPYQKLHLLKNRMKATKWLSNSSSWSYGKHPEKTFGGIAPKCWDFIINAYNQNSLFCGFITGIHLQHGTKTSPLVLTNEPSFEAGYGRASLPEEVGYRWIGADNRKTSVTDLEYLVVKDGDDLGEVPQRELTYSDTEVEKDRRYVYQVKAIYGDGTSVLSDEFAIVYEEGLANGQLERAGLIIWSSEGGINIRQEGGSGYDVWIQDMGGQVIARVSEVSGSDLFIPLSVPTGIYFVKIVRGKEMFVKKVLVR